MDLFHIFSLCLLISIISALKENDKCDGGICIKYDSCTFAQEAVLRGKTPPICTYDEGEPIVCCPSKNSNFSDRASTSPTQTNSGEKSKEMCRRYSEYAFEHEESPILTATSHQIKTSKCVTSATPLIVGGEYARLNEFPHMALIGLGEVPQWKCGGSLISERFVLSAAHCSSQTIFPCSNCSQQVINAEWVKLGDLNLTSSSEGATPQDVRISQRFVHPQYNGGKQYNDIVLFKLEKDVELSPSLRPICLHVDSSTPSSATATGWGLVKTNGAPSGSLKKVKLNLLPQAKCETFYPPKIFPIVPDGILETVMICAGDRKDEDTCQGDSGGPLQISTPHDDPHCSFLQIGIVSFGTANCAAGRPAVYTRVSHYIPWIESIVWPN